METASPRHRVTAVFCLLLCAAAAHAGFVWTKRTVRPELTIIDPPPGLWARDALSLGDHEFLYRYWGLDLQNDGDTGGRATPMRKYNYDYVLGWLEALRSLDSKAQFHAFLATRYFSWTPAIGDVRRLVTFIVEDATAEPARKWYWLTQAIDMAEHRLNDRPLALALARQLAAYDFPDQPTWTWLFPAVLLEKDGRYDEARAVIDDVRKHKIDRLEPETINWMNDFQQRLPQP